MQNDAKLSAGIAKKLLEERKKLPIWTHKCQLISAVRASPNLVIVSSTGSGKSTQLPQFLYKDNLTINGAIAISQPRRIAAITVAQRVADELGLGPVGQGPVGYCVRFEDCSDVQRTHLRYMTDGMLLREAILDPLLRRYSIVIVDEAHERSLNTEVLLGVLLNASQKRKIIAAATATTVNGNSVKELSPLKIIIMSATIDPESFVTFLGPKRTRVIYIEGRRFPIKILNSLQPSLDYVTDAAITCIQMHSVSTCPPDRGILVFLTGEDEINRCVALIRRLYHEHLADGTKRGNKKFGADENGKNQMKLAGLVVFPLFSALPQTQQLRALTFSKQGVRKIIVSTNIAETSITIPGIRYVVDCGRAKVLEYDPKTGIEALRVRWVSKSQAWQRAGRAGRESAGVCLRLYTDDEYSEMSLHPASELQSAPFAGILLNLLSMGVKNVIDFPWLEAPGEALVKQGFHLLEHLGALGDGSSSGSSMREDHESVIPCPPILSKVGELMSAFPLDPRLARVFVSAGQTGCLVEALTAVSMLYVSPVFYVPPEKRRDFSEVAIQFRHPAGDLASLVLVYRAYIKCSKVRGKETKQKDSTLSGTMSRKVWCRDNYVNLSRLATAVRVRNQLKAIALSSKVGKMESCGEDLYKLTAAFLDVAYRDQVVVLANNLVDNDALPSHNSQSSLPIYQRLTSAHGNRLPGDERDEHLLSIHPDSQVYPTATNVRCAPSALLFIDAVDASPESFPVASEIGEKLADKSSRARIFMRHVCPLKAQWLVPTKMQQNASPHLLNGTSSAPRKRPATPDVSLTECMQPNLSEFPTPSLASAKRRRRRKQQQQQQKNRHAAVIT